MLTVWKFPLYGNGTDIFRILMPKWATILKLSIQGNTPTIWALCSPESPKGIRTFRMIGTGMTIGAEATYIDSLQTQIDGAEFVWHFFEVPTEDA